MRYWRGEPPGPTIAIDRDFAVPLCQAWPRPLPRAYTAVMRPYGGRSRFATPLGRDRFLAKIRLSKRPRRPAVRANHRKIARLSWVRRPRCWLRGLVSKGTKGMDLGPKSKKHPTKLI